MCYRRKRRWKIVDWRPCRGGRRGKRILTLKAVASGSSCLNCIVTLSSSRTEVARPSLDAPQALPPSLLGDNFWDSIANTSASITSR